MRERNDCRGVTQVLWGEVVVSFVSEKEQLIVGTEFDWKPV